MFYPEFRLLRCFAAIAETQSITRAAERLNLSQPTVSGQIREFEQAVGFALFDRTSRSVTLTPQGKALLPLVHAVLEGGERIRCEVENQQARRARQFRLGAAMYTLDLTERSALLDAFAEAMPGYGYAIDNRLQSDQVPDLVSGRLDLSFLLGVPIDNWEQGQQVSRPGLVANESTYPASLQRVVLRRMKIGMVMPETSPLACHAIVPRGALAGETVAMLSVEHGHAITDPLDAFFRGCGAHPHYLAEGNAFAIARHAARHGISAIGIDGFPLPPGTCYRPVEGLDLHLDFGLVISPGANHAARGFFDFAVQWQARRSGMPQPDDKA